MLRFYYDTADIPSVLALSGDVLQKIANMLPASPKTAYRDIRPLKQAGVLQIRYNEVFGPISPDFAKPEWPENKTQKLYLEKIIWCYTLTVQLDSAKNPINWYQARYPSLSDRTQESSKIGYQIVYNPVHDPNQEREQYYPRRDCDFPTGAYDITF